MLWLSSRATATDHCWQTWAVWAEGRVMMGATPLASRVMRLSDTPHDGWSLVMRSAAVLTVIWLGRFMNIMI